MSCFCIEIFFRHGHWQCKSFLLAALSDVVTNIFFGEGKAEQPIHLDNVHCSGMELSLLNCAHNGLGRSDCRHDEDVGIICKRYPST